MEDQAGTNEEDEWMNAIKEFCCLVAETERLIARASQGVDTVSRGDIYRGAAIGRRAA